MTDSTRPDPLQRIKAIRAIVDAIKSDPNVVDLMDDIVELALTELTVQAASDRIVDLTEIPDDIEGLDE